MWFEFTSFSFAYFLTESWKCLPNCLLGGHRVALKSQNASNWPPKWVHFAKKVLVAGAEHISRSQYCRERNLRGLVTLQQPWFMLKMRKTCYTHENEPGGTLRRALGQSGGVKYCPCYLNWPVFRSSKSSQKIPFWLQNHVKCFLNTQNDLKISWWQSHDFISETPPFDQNFRI